MPVRLSKMIHAPRVQQGHESGARAPLNVARCVHPDPATSGKLVRHEGLSTGNEGAHRLVMCFTCVMSARLPIKPLPPRDILCGPQVRHSPRRALPALLVVDQVGMAPLAVFR